MSPLRHASLIAQAVVVRVLFFTARLLPLDVASALGGSIAKTLGPMLGIHKTARKNLLRAFPHLPRQSTEAILRGMWDNLGRSAFEFAHVDRLNIYTMTDRFQVENAEALDALRDDGKPGIFLTAHLSNWELGPMSCAHRGLPVHSVYRAPNNPYMRSLFAKRGADSGELIPKGAKGARRMIQLLGKGEHLGLLADQKMNDGIAVPFFGSDAMTAPAVAQLALKYDCPIVPAQFIRRSGARFKIIFHPPMDIENTGDRAADVARIMGQVNALYEDWITQHPDQWLWLHNRWPND